MARETKDLSYQFMVELGSHFDGMSSCVVPKFLERVTISLDHMQHSIEEFVMVNH